MSSPVEQQALEDIATRRQRGVRCDGVELRARIQALGDMQLDQRTRHEAFDEVYDALTPSGFRLMVWPDRTSIGAADNELRITAVLVDEHVHRQAAGEITRHFMIDQGLVSHDLLRMQGPYRGAGLSHVLLNQAFPFYRQIGLQAVIVHAALETGRWHWARMGFDFEPTRSRLLVETWAMLCLAALGEPLLPTGFPPSQLALLGFGPSGETTSFKALRNALEAEVARRLADPATRTATEQFRDWCDRRFQDEIGLGWLDVDRFEWLAAANNVGFDQDAPLGKVVMLAGPDWWGTFDLTSSAAQQVFDAEFQRRFATR